MKRILVLSLMVALLVSAPLLAQAPPPPQGGGQQGGPGGPGGQQAGPAPDVVLKDALGFTDDQLAALKSLVDTHRQALDALQSKLADAEKALADALKATSPDATQVGTLLLAVQTIRGQMDKAHEAFRTSFGSLLTSEQQQRLAAIQNLQKSLQAGQVLRQLGL
jgi:Spy/CpxP family protein refolding chaperone